MRKVTMISLFTYREARQMAQERQRRSLAVYEARRKTPNDSYVRPTVQDAEVIELAFGPACEPDSLGA